MKFDKITIGAKSIINSYIDKTRYLTSNYALPVILTWFDLVEPEYCIYNDTLYIRAILDGRRIYLAPLTAGSFNEAVNTLKDYSKEISEPLEIILAIEEQIDDLEKEGYFIVSNRDYAEYVYLSEDLINLNGKKYHSKRNHINTFKRKYSYEFRKVNSSDKAGILKLLNRWAVEKGEDASSEVKMVKYFLDHMDDLDIFADVLVVDGQIIGTAIGECSNPDMGVVMYEKCDYRYDGSCASINQFFANKHFQGVKYINRQEDMGIEGLRKAKLSYHPARIGHRWTIKIKE